MRDIGGEKLYERICKFPGISDPESWISIENLHVNFYFDFNVAYSMLQLLTTPHDEWQIMHNDI